MLFGQEIAHDCHRRGALLFAVGTRFSARLQISGHAEDNVSRCTDSGCDCNGHHESHTRCAENAKYSSVNRTEGAIQSTELILSRK